MDEARQLVAPELRAALDLFPPLDLSDQSIAAFRQPFATRPAEPMPEALAAADQLDAHLAAFRNGRKS